MALKALNARERNFAKALAEGTGSIQAARLFLRWKCEPNTSQYQKAKDLARSPRIIEEVERIRAADMTIAKATTIVVNSTKLDLTNLRQFAYDRLCFMRDDPDVPAKSRYTAIQALERLNDPSKDINLIYRWIDLMWQFYTGHCPACHKDFPLWKVKNERLSNFRDGAGITVDETIEDESLRRLELVKVAEKRRHPHPGQVRALIAPERHIVGVGPARAGKLLHPDTPILTLKGWKLYKELQLGDSLFDEKGKPTKIIDFTEKWDTGEWYKITFDTGEEIIAHENHEFVTNDYNYRAALCSRTPGREQRRKLTPSLVTTKEIKQSLYARKKHANHAIPIADPLCFETQELPVNPYLLGVWLGDGTSHNGHVTSADEEVLTRLQSLGYKVTKVPSGKYAYNIEGLNKKLRLLGLKDNKLIPSAYLFSDKTQRLELLRGLMDTDGTVDKNGRCSFDNTNINLVEGVMFLLASLGIKRSMTSRTGKLNGVSHKMCYRVNFTTKVPIFTLKRKLDRLPLILKTTQKYRYIVDVQPAAPSSGRCITVSGDSHLYLAGTGLIPTHNSFTLAMFCLLYLMIPGVEIWILARVYDDAAPEFDYLDGFIKTLFNPVSKHMVNVSVDQKSGEASITTRWGSVLKLKSGKAQGSITGRELEFAGVAEPAWVDAKLYEELRARMSSRLGRIVALGTPKGFGGFIHRMVKQAGRGPDGKIRSPEDRQVVRGCPWAQSLLFFNYDANENPAYVKSEKEAARSELTKEEFASEFEGLMMAAEGARFPYITQKALVNVSKETYNDCVFILGVDQGPKNFGSCLVGYDGHSVYTAWEFFDNSDMSIRANLIDLNYKVGPVIFNMGGNADNWQLTIFDADPPVQGILDELKEENKAWRTEETYRPKNMKDLTNWREETMEWINGMAQKGRFFFDAKECDMLHDQIREALIQPRDTNRESALQNTKGWIVKDLWRGDHVMDAWLMACYCIMTGQLSLSVATMQRGNAYEEEQRHQDYMRISDEKRQLNGEVNDNAVWKQVYGYDRPGGGSIVEMGQPGWYSDEG